jgi:arginine/lysine/ornithine decarboxylase
MMTIMDTEEGWQRLADAICRIDDRIEADMQRQSAAMQRRQDVAEQPEMRMTPAEAFHGAQEEIPLSESVGRVMADFIQLYPPGIPLLVPGEVMNKDIRSRIEDSLRIGLCVHGVSGEGKVAVLDERAGNVAL